MTLMNWLRRWVARASGKLPLRERLRRRRPLRLEHLEDRINLNTRLTFTSGVLTIDVDTGETATLAQTGSGANLSITDSGHSVVDNTGGGAPLLISGGGTPSAQTNDPNAATDITTVAITGAGTVQLTASNVLSSGWGLTIDASGIGGNPGTFDLAGFNQSVAALNGSGTVTNSAASSTATLTDSGGGSFAGALQDGGSGKVTALTVSGGTLTLSGANTYSGATSVSGTLNLTGALTSNTTVNSGGTVTGSGDGSMTGIITGTLTIDSGGTVAPTHGIGTPLTVTGDATLSSGSTFSGVLASASTGDYSQLAVGGIPTVSGANLSIDATGAGPSTASPQSFRIVKNTGSSAVSGTFSGLPEGAPVTVTGSSVKPSITYNGGLANNIDLNTQPVINGTTGADGFIFRKSTTAGMNEYSTNGGATFTQIANTLGITVNGGAGADTFTYDFSNGDPGVSVTFNGGGQSGDTLVVTDTAKTRTAVYRVDTATTPHNAGSVVVGTDTVSFTGVAPTDITGMANVNIDNTTFVNANQNLTIANGTNSGGNPSINVSGTTGGVGFETLRLRNDTSVSIDTSTPAGNDTVTINSADGTAAQANVTNLSLNTGTGTDTVTIAGTGTISLPGTLSITTQTLNITAGTTTAGTINLTASGAITESGGGLVSTTGTLTTSSATGTALGSTNTVASFTASNSTSGAISLTNSATTLAITGITQSGTVAGSNISVTNTGNVTTSTAAITTQGAPANGTIFLKATTGALTIGAAVSAGGAGTVTLTNTGAGNNMTVNAAVSSGTGDIIPTSSGSISGTGTFSTGGTLNTTSKGGTTLTNGNTASKFTASNATSGDITLTNTAAPLTITGINEAGGGNVSVTNTGSIGTTGDVSTVANGNISLTATSGAETIGAGVSAGGSGTVMLSNTGSGNNMAINGAVASGSGAITLNSAGTISGTGNFTTTGQLTTTSTGGATLTAGSFVGSFQASNSTSGAISLVNTTTTLTIVSISQTGTAAGSNVSVTNTGALSTSGAVTTAATANGTIGLTATGGTLTVGAAVTAGGSGSVTLSATGSSSDLLVNAGVSSTTGFISGTAGRNITFGTSGSVATSKTAAGGTVTLQSGSTGALTQSGTGTTVTGNSVGLTAGSVGTSSQSLVLDATSLTLNTSGNNGNQFLAEANTAKLQSSTALNAGNGTITLTAGTFQITSGAAGDAIANSSPLVITSPGTLDLNGNNETITSLSDGGGTGGSVTLGSGTLTTGNNTTSTTFSGIISGSGGLTKAGSDTFTLSGSNTYTGTTTVNAGTLTVNGALNNNGTAGGGVVNLQAAGVVLNGTGTIKGQVNINASTSGSPTKVQQVNVNVLSGNSTGISLASGLTNVMIGGSSLGVTVNNTGSSTGILVQTGNSGTLTATLTGNTITGTGSGAGNTSIGVKEIGSAPATALMTNVVFMSNSISGNNQGVQVTNATALLQSNNINNNNVGSSATGLLVQSAAIVDAGQSGAASYYGNFTGLGMSTGGNSFTGYTAMASNTDLGSPQAIRDLNTGAAPFPSFGAQISSNYGAVGPQLGRMDVTALGNTWGTLSGSGSALKQVEDLIYHDVDSQSLGFVDYGNSSTPPNVVGTPQYSANFNLSNTVGGTGTLFSGSQNPSGATQQWSVIRYVRVVYDSFVFLDPTTPGTNLGLNLALGTHPYGSYSGVIHANLFSASYDEASGNYTVIYSFSGSGTEYGSLQDGNYTLSFFTSGIQGGGPGGAALASNPYSSNAASFQRLFGDAHGLDATTGLVKVNNADLSAIQQALNSRVGMANYRAYFDFANRGYINSLDYSAFRSNRYGYRLNANGTLTAIDPSQP